MSWRACRRHAAPAGAGQHGRTRRHPPAVDFHATLVDRDGTTVEVNRLNIGGDVQLEGDMGRGSLRIAFDNIKRIELSPDSHDYRPRRCN